MNTEQSMLKMELPDRKKVKFLDLLLSTTEHLWVFTATAFLLFHFLRDSVTAEYFFMTGDSSQFCIFVQILIFDFSTVGSVFSFPVTCTNKSTDIRSQISIETTEKNSVRSTLNHLQPPALRWVNCSLYFYNIQGSESVCGSVYQQWNQAPSSTGLSLLPVSANWIIILRSVTG